MDHRAQASTVSSTALTFLVPCNAYLSCTGLQDKSGLRHRLPSPWGGCSGLGLLLQTRPGLASCPRWPRRRRRLWLPQRPGQLRRRPRPQPRRQPQPQPWPRHSSAETPVKTRPGGVSMRVERRRRQRGPTSQAENSCDSMSPTATSSPDRTMFAAMMAPASAADDSVGADRAAVAGASSSWSVFSAGGGVPGCCNGRGTQL